MLSNRPYLLRAFYQWITDSACTPILVVDADHPRSKIPQEYAEGGEIVFNISSTAIRDLKMTNELVEFKASFSGVIHIISVPISGIFAVYAEENGEGIFFDAEEDADEGDVASAGDFVLTGIEGSLKSSIEQPVIDAGERAARAKSFLKLVE